MLEPDFRFPIRKQSVRAKQAVREKQAVNLPLFNCLTLKLHKDSLMLPRNNRESRAALEFFLILNVFHSIFLYLMEDKEVRIFSYIIWNYDLEECAADI